MAVADFDGDGRAEIVVTSLWGIGILTPQGNSFTNPVVAANGTALGDGCSTPRTTALWPWPTSMGTGRAEILVTSPWGIGILKPQGNTFTNPVVAANGTRFGGWLLNTADNRIVA